jgi:hypothetical protein
MSATQAVCKPPVEEPEIAVAPTAVAVEAPVVSPSRKTCSFSLTLCGDIRVRGPIASRNTFITLFGNHQLDISGYELLPQQTVKICTIKICGDVRLIVPPNTTVSVNSIMLCGDRDVDTGCPTTQDAPHVKLIFIAPLCGSLKVTNA